MRSNWHYLLLALILGVFSWYQVSGRERIETWIQVPVEFTNIPEGLEIRQGMVNRVEIRIRGPKGLVRGVEPKSLAYTLNLSGLKPGLNTIAFEPGNVPLRRVFEIMEFSPQRIELIADSLATKQVPVIPKWSARLSPDYQLTHAEARPDLVTVRGPEPILRTIKSVSTQTIEIDDTTPDAWEGDVYLAVPDGVTARPASVSVALRFSIKMADTWLKVPVRADGGRGLRARPEVVRVHVECPAPLLRNENFGKDIVAFVKSGDTVPPTEGRQEYTVPLADGCRLLGAEPRSVTVIPAAGTGRQTKTTGRQAPARRQR